MTPEAGPSGTSDTAGAVLVPGTTCWRSARAHRLAVIIDAAAYCAHLKVAILKSRHSILLIGWDFDTRVELDRDAPASSVPNRVGRLLNYVVRRNPELHVYVLRWDLAFLKMPLRGTTPLFLLEWLGRRRLHFHLDRHHPADWGCPAQC